MVDNNLTSLVSVIEQVKQLDALDLRTCAFKEVATLVRTLMRGYACVTRSVNAEPAYRARKHVANECFGRVSDLWYPPSGSVVRPGRCNAVGESIFYIEPHDRLTATR